MIDFIGEKIKTDYDKEDLFLNIQNNRSTRVYDDEVFIENNLLNIFDFEIYKIEKVEAFRSELNAKKPYSLEEKLIDKNLYPSRNVRMLSILYDKLTRRYNIEINHNLKGLMKNTEVAIFIKDTNTAIISPNHNPDDILNLLTIKGLNIFISSAIVINQEFYYIIINLIPTNKFHSLYQKEIENREKKVKIIKQSLKEISKLQESEMILPLENKIEIRNFVENIDENNKRLLHNFMAKRQGMSVVNFLSSIESKDFEILSKKIPDFHKMMNTLYLVHKYMENHKEQIKEDKNRNRYQRDVYALLKYKIKFADFKLLLKALNQKYNSVSKWIEQAIDIYNTQKKQKDYLPNTKGIYYQAASDLANELSRLWFISEVILFGSVSKGKENENSDIDIAYKIGFDVSSLTQVRKRNLHQLVLRTVRDVTDKYRDKIKGRLMQTRRSIAFNEPEIFNILSLSLQKKSDLNVYHKAGFFDSAITLFKRDNIKVIFEEKEEYINYNDIDAVIVPARPYQPNTDTSFSKILKETDNYLYLKCYIYDFENMPCITLTRFEKIELHKKFFRINEYNIIKSDNEWGIQYFLENKNANDFLVLLNTNQNLDYSLSELLTSHFEDRIDFLN